jgi:spermidine/putrescine transport system substrate-binding protein
MEIEMDITEFKKKLDAGTLTRRELQATLAGAGLAAVMMPLVPGSASAAEEAIYFTWSGYDIPELFPAYIEKYGQAPETPLFADNEETFIKMKSGFQVDVAHPCSFHTGRWRDAGIIQPIDTSRLSNWGDVFPDLKTLQTTQADGEQWFVPFDWGQTSITYRTDIVELEEESWSLLWDERYAGRLAMLGAAEDAWWCAAIYAGIDVNNVTDEDLVKVRDLLEEQRPLLRFYSNDTTSIEQALATGELVAAMTWNSSPLELTAQGIPVRFLNPKEGALTWVCGLVLATGAPHYDKAHELIDAMIGPRPGIFLIEEYGYGHSNMKAFEAVDEEVLVARGLSKDPLSILEAGVFIPSASPEVNTKIERDWSEVTAGF